MRIAPANVVAGASGSSNSPGKLAPVTVNVGTKKRPGSREDLKNRNEAAFFGCLYFTLYRCVVAVADEWQSICSFNILRIDCPAPFLF
jgi:hypothetical protein